MCYGCRPTCEDCKPKFVYCRSCGSKNFLFSKKCKVCSACLTEDMKKEDVMKWRLDHQSIS